MVDITKKLNELNVKLQGKICYCEKSKKYITVQDEVDHKDKQPPVVESSDESEEDVPIIKQLMQEIGVREEEPESEIEEGGTEEDEDVGDSGQEEESGEEAEEAELADSDASEADSMSDSADNPTVESQKQDPSLEKDEANDGEEINDDEVDEDIVAEEVDEESDNEHQDELSLKESDPFTKHFELETDISEIVENTSLKWRKKELKLPGLGESLLFYKTADHLPDPESHSDLKKLHVKHKLCNKVRSTNTQLASVELKSGESLNHFQHRLFCAINGYQDLLYPKETHHNTEEVRMVYCLHALNHILKTRSRVVAHNTKIKSKKNKDDDDVEYRDQGLTRPKVLILLPYRDRALKVFNMIISLLSSSEKVGVSSRKRFESEYSELDKSNLAEKTYKPDDFKKTFEGNIDDNFRVGLSIAKKSVRLYSPFYESDIILASPLGLRTVIGLEGDRDRDYDFLSSIEVLIIDQADIFLMQNWDHFTHVMNHLHLQPKESHGVDFSRVRMWAINGWSKHFRQTLMFSSVILPELLMIFNKHCHNFTGKLLVQRDIKTGTIRSCVSDTPQIFHRVPCDAPDGLTQRKAKFEYFKKKIVPYHTSAGMKQTLIYCNYYSFVMLRNYFRETEADFLFINEYDTEKHMRNARIHFRKRHPHFMLYTERLHFHYRFRLRGIHHILWFDLPQYPQFYPELLNLMETDRQSCTTTALFTRYDAQKLVEIIGNKQAAHMLNSEKSVNMITVS
ncbi:U3 small nucleolar RNA-associated protein 25 homolog isoform X2 [Physella acuta]|uniref:U3 small nucleolar RNA-associated protein 25 homolog isoform X2 n=1 Tax=Physella acuta TaxID=109671 RepID=UPI0027DAD553|nr:U3 small nucleolar RNA-associated protein 25 homolog isoform X2 [Physella acuta]